MSFIEKALKKINSDAEFIRVYANLEKLSAIKELNQNKFISFNKDLLMSDHDLNYLLRCSGPLSQSKNELDNLKSLKIAHYCIEYGDISQRTAAYIILDQLLNRESIKLAVKRDLLDKNIAYKMPLKSELAYLNRQLSYTVNVFEEDNVFCNKFQKEFWDMVNNEENIVSISSPTSSGKSFIVRKWIKSALCNSLSIKNIVVIVPTRALINEYNTVFKDELKDYKDKIDIISNPIVNLNSPSKNKLFIFTQERFLAFLSKNENLNIDIVFIDEAYKISDGSRGILLEAVLDKVVQKSNKTKMVFASPFIENPEEIYNGSSPLKNNNHTVTKNIYKVDKVDGSRKKWNIKTLSNGSFKDIAELNLPKPVTSSGKVARLSSIPYYFGKNTGKNLIYADDGNSVEKIAHSLNQLLTSDLETNNLSNKSDNEDIQNLIDVCKDYIHKDFAMCKTLKSGVGYHYGSLPQAIRMEVERLFTKGDIKFLICTSTLLEGVNLGCQNIYIKEPMVGRNPMSNDNISNLIGRAGRLGKEFSGNIFYIDWRDSPEEVKEVKIDRVIKKVLKDHLNILINLFLGKVDFNSDNLRGIEKLIESAAGYIFNTYMVNGNTIKKSPHIVKIVDDKLEDLEHALSVYRSSISLDDDLILRHPMIYHRGMQDLYDKFIADSYRIDMLIPKLDYKKSYLSILNILKYMRELFNTDYPDKPTYHALITSKWIGMKKVSVIISEAIEYFKNMEDSQYRRRDGSLSIDRIIRDVLRDIEDIARYSVPKLVFCYIDVLNSALISMDRKDLIIPEKENISTLMEYGVNNMLHVSLIHLGVSRSTVIALMDLNKKEDIFKGEKLSPVECVKALKDNESLIKDSINTIYYREIDSIINDS